MKVFMFTVWYSAISSSSRLTWELKDWETCNLGGDNLRINHTDIVYAVYKQLRESPEPADSARPVIASRVEPKNFLFLMFSPICYTADRNRCWSWALTFDGSVFQKFKNVDRDEEHADMSTLASPASQNSPDVYILPLTEVSLPVAKQPSRSGGSLASWARIRFRWSTSTHLSFNRRQSCI